MSPPTSHFPAMIDGLLDWSQEHDSPAAHARLLRHVTGSAALRLEARQDARRFARAATAALITAHRTRHPKTTH